jgi:hypothetical protein
MIDSLPTTSAAFAELAASFDEVLDPGQMMGRPCLFLVTQGRRQMLACLDAEVLGVRLGRTTDAFAEAMAVPGATVFSPGAGRRAFADWVALPATEHAGWEHHVAAALALATP